MPPCLATNRRDTCQSKGDRLTGRAPWIWDRLDWVIRRLGLKAKQVSRGLDWCHAVHHISLALEPLLDEADRKRVFKKLRKWLKAGSWRKVVRELMILTVDAEDAKLPRTSPV